MPIVFPEPILEVCRQLEERKISTWSHGEGLLTPLRPVRSAEPARAGLQTTPSLLCLANPEELLEALPRAVVTASRARRLTLATRAGPIDLLPVGHGDLEAVLLDFGLSVFAFAFRPTEERWCDPLNARASFKKGILDVTVASPNPFEVAPRRFWISGRLLSEHALEPSARLLEAASAALPKALEHLPQAAPARREIGRILASLEPERGLSFLRECGVSAALFPGMDPSGETMVAGLAPLPALRWAAWLNGTGIQRALVRLRMPIALARQIERIHRSHPIERRIESMHEVGVRKMLGRLDAEEIDGLFEWRRLELDTAPRTEKTLTQSKRLDALEAQIEEARHREERGIQVRKLAIDGRAVMTALGAGPGRDVGRALAHLARFVEADPDSNEPNALDRELRRWATKNADAIG